MPRKFALLAATMLGVSFALTGLAFAAEYAGDLEKQMETINKKTAAIRKATKSAAAWKKDGKTVAADALEIAKLAKEAKKDKTSAEKVKKPQADWEKHSDELIKAADALAVLAAKADTTQPQAKEAFGAVNKSCTECHAIFRVEDEK